jgi:TatD DNase family protein
MLEMSSAGAAFRTILLLSLSNTELSGALGTFNWKWKPLLADGSACSPGSFEKTPSSRMKRYPFVDAHCHLNFYPDPVGVARRAASKDVYTLAVTNSPAAYRDAVLLLGEFPLVRVALGLHPKELSDSAQKLREFTDLLATTRYVGEVGLDYVFRDHPSRAVQRRVFEKIVEECDQAGGKVLSVHSLRAAKDILEVFGTSFRGTVILHWYQDSFRDLERAVERGFYFSVNEAMFRNEHSRRIVTRIPSDRLLTETDGPFGLVNDRPVEPRDIPHVLAHLRDLGHAEKELSAERIWTAFRAATAETGDGGTAGTAFEGVLTGSSSSSSQTAETSSS